MDTSDPKIVFNKNGRCNHCLDYEKRKRNFIIPDSEKKKECLNKIVTKIKKAGQKKTYDCIIGVSGGVDSSYVAYLAKEFCLRALLVHLDNGWDSEVAVKNIENVIKSTGFDLYTHVIDWEEFCDLQRSFFKASVIDIEMLSDHAISAIISQAAKKYKVKYILSGQNFATECILPSSWVHRKSDLRNIKAIHKCFGTKKIKTFPMRGTFAYLWDKFWAAQEIIPLLDYVDYDKNQAMQILEREFSWRYYGGKHFESIFTRFYQGYILPKKFHIDKRRAHLSSLICTSQMTREQALIELEKEIYPRALQNEDKDLLCKKLRMSNKEFEMYMQRPPRSHYEFASDETLLNRLLRLNTWIKKLKARQ